MLLFVGLGNPTPDSENNRHNVGFKIIDSINKKFGLSKGSYMCIKRVLSCHPIKLLGGGSSFDFVPNKNNLKKENSNG